MRRVKVGDVLELQRRQVQVDPATEYREIGVRSFGRGLFHKEPVTGIELGNKRVFEIHPGDLVFSNVFAWEGAVGLASGDDSGRIGSHRFMTYIARDAEEADVGYLRHYFTSERGVELLGIASPGSAGRNRTLAVERFEAIEIPLPDIDEQRRIAAHLDRVAGTMRRLEQDLVAQDAFPSAELLPGLISQVLEAYAPEQTAVGELYQVVSDVVHPGDPYGRAECFVGLQHIESHVGRCLGFDPLGEEKGRKFRFQPGDVVFGYLRPYLNKVWVADRTGLCSVDQYVLRPTEGVDPHLLAYVLRSSDTLAQSEELTHNLQLPRLRSKLLKGIIGRDPRTFAPEVRTSLDDLTAKVVMLGQVQERRRELASAVLPSALNRAFAGLA